MQEMQMPDGGILREFFSELEVKLGVAKARRNCLEATHGAKFLRMVWVDRSKYEPHQGAREMARRVRQMEAA